MHSRTARSSAWIEKIHQLVNFKEHQPYWTLHQPVKNSFNLNGYGFMWPNLRQDSLEDEMTMSWSCMLPLLSVPLVHKAHWNWCKLIMFLFHLFCT